MKRILLFTLSLLGLVSLAVSCGKDFVFEIPVEIRAMQFGYYKDNSENAERFEEGQVDNTTFVAFNDRVSIDEALKEGSTEFGDVKMTESRYEFSPDQSELELKTYPENAQVKSLEVVSSDESILKVVSVEGKKVKVSCRKTGEVSLSVKVRGAVNTMEAEYPVRVVSRVDLDFHITAYWLSSLVTRLRLRPSYLPLDRSSLTTHIEDSVTVIGYCEYYDFHKYGSRRLFKRDTITFPKETKEVLLKKNRLLVLRNITDAIRKIRHKAETGSYIRIQSSGARDTLTRDYGYIVEQVIVDFNIFGADRNLEYYFTSKCERSTETYDEESGEVIDNETDDDIDYVDGVSRTMERTEKNYYVIKLNDFLTDSQRDSISNSFNDKLNRYGYDEDKLSDEEKQKMLDEINSHKSEDEK